MRTHTLLFTLLLFLCSIQVNAQYAIGQQDFTYTDASRSNRNVSAEIYYPATAAGQNAAVATGQFPVIAFGHGFTTVYTEYSVWWEALVPLGYIVIFPETEGGLFGPSHPNFGLDLAFVAETFKAQSADPTSDFFDSWNGMAAVMGHSMGGGCSYLAADGTSTFNTLISLAAADTNPSSVAAAANLTIPSLTIGGSADCVVMSGGAPIDHYNSAAAAPYKAYAEITDASHCQFGIASGGSFCTLGELCSGFLAKATQHQYMLELTTPWLDFYLKEDCSAWDVFHNYLTTATTHTYQEAGTAPQAIPAETAVSVISGNVVKLDFSDIDQATKYRIQYRVVGGTWTEVSNTINYRFLNQLMPNTMYEYRLKAVCPGGNSAWSSLYTFTTASDICDFPEATPTATNITSNSAVIGWNADADDLKYKVQYKPAGTSTWIQVFANITSSSITGLSANTTYKYKVKTKCSGGWTNWGDKYEFSTAASFGATPALKTSTVDISLFPNPVVNKTTLAIHSASTNDAQITVMDATGRIVYQNVQTVLAGQTSIELDTNDWISGIYFIQITGKQLFESIKMIKK